MSPIPPPMHGGDKEIFEKYDQEMWRFMSFGMSLGHQGSILVKALPSICCLFRWRKIDFVDVNKAIGHCHQAFFWPSTSIVHVGLPRCQMCK